MRTKLQSHKLCLKKKLKTEYRQRNQLFINYFNHRNNEGKAFLFCVLSQDVRNKTSHVIPKRPSVCPEPPGTKQFVDITQNDIIALHPTRRLFVVYQQPFVGADSERHSIFVTVQGIIVNTQCLFLSSWALAFTFVNRILSFFPSVSIPLSHRKQLQEIFIFYF